MVRRWLAAHYEPLLLALILGAGAVLRLYGLNWDGGQWLHPDERQIYFVSLGLSWPQSLAQAFRPDSPLNPHFFAYGSLPIYLLRIAAGLVAPLSPILRNPDNLHLVGRPLAALFDLGTIYLTYRLVKKLEVGGWRLENRRSVVPAALLAAALASVAVLSIQLAHFYTADILLTFFVMLSLNLAADVAQGGGVGRQLGLGVAVGLAMATKVSAAPLLLVMLVAFGMRAGSSSKRQETGSKSQAANGMWQATSRKGQAARDEQLSAARDAHVPSAREPGSRIPDPASPIPDDLSSGPHILLVVKGVSLAAIAAAAVFFVAQPYAVFDWRTFLADTVRESQIAWGQLDVPYTRQYAGTLPYLYSIWQTALWGLGLPLGLAGWAGFGLVATRWLRRGSRADTLLLAWAGPYLAITGLFHTRYLRYMLPLVPVLCVFAAWLLAGQREPRAGQAKARPGRRLRRKVAAVAGGSVVLFSLGYAIAFASLYAAPHSWIAASKWIYETVPVGSTLAIEDWDTPLPLPLNVSAAERRIEEYDVRVLALYDEPDGAAKWSSLASDLAVSDYVVVASRRLYGSIPRLPERYPLASRYYDLLFGGDLGFELAAEFGRAPGWLNPPLAPLAKAIPAWLVPDESAVVYDHPRVLLLRNTGHLSAAEILQCVGSP